MASRPEIRKSAAALTQTTSSAATTHGHVDAIADGVVSGWAIDLGQKNEAASLFIFIDGRPVDNIHCTIERPDVVAAGFPTLKCGFLYDIPARFCDESPHSISIRFSSGKFLFNAENKNDSQPEMTFRLSPPLHVKGVVDGFSSGAVRGWALRTDPETGRKSGGLDILVLSEGEVISRIRADRYRADVGSALNADAFCGFAFVPPLTFHGKPSKALEFRIADTGTGLEGSPVQVEAPHADTRKIAEIFNSIRELSISSFRIENELRSLLVGNTYRLGDYDAWFRRYLQAARFRTKVAAARNGREGSPAASEPLISVLCPVYRPRLEDFVAAVKSVMAQTYRNWELIIVDDRSDAPELTACIQSLAAEDARIRVFRQPKNGGISLATNAAIKMAKGSYIAFFDHDDMLVDIALEVMVGAAMRTGAKMLYSDEDKIEDRGGCVDPNLKPDWNYRLLLGQNYVCHLLLVEADTLREVGPLRPEYDGAQDHDLILRLSEVLPVDKIFHVPEILYHWRKTPSSTATASGVKSYAAKAGVAAVTDHLKRRKLPAKVSAIKGMTLYDVTWSFTEEPPVCIIIPFKDQIETTRKCVETILGNTKYKNFEIILVDNWSNSTQAREFSSKIQQNKNIRVMRVEEPFNYSRLNN
ncbi:MAG TPA: glycosyltransferase, partial [Acetobacteraceae bacterium]|nr:glycosyltransferase [Acetobacteraceae bacterium]